MNRPTLMHEEPNVANLSAYITRVRDVNEGKFHYQLPTINYQLIGKA